jgi:azurin
MEFPCFTHNVRGKEMKLGFTTLFVAVLMFTTDTLEAAECSIEITAGDNLAYNMSEIALPSTCEEVVVTFKHLGSLPAAVMGHNFVVAKSSDLQPIQNDANKVGMAGDWLLAGDDRVIISSKIIGGGESTEIVLRPEWLKASDEYSFFCTVMSHSVVMRGSIK